MRKWLSIVAILLAFAGLSPIRGQQVDPVGKALTVPALDMDSGRNRVGNAAHSFAGSRLLIANFVNQIVERDGFDWLAYWAAIVLAVAVLTGVVVAVSALKWLKIQTLAAKANADFALLNARALVNAERAWMMVTLTSTKEGVYTIIAENVGKTPAKLVSSFADVSIIRTPKTLPVTPAYKTQCYEGMIPIICFPQDRRQIFEITVPEIIESAYPYGNAPSNALEFMDIFFFGRVVYHDTLNTGNTPESSPVHETRWCFKLLTLANSAPISHPYVSPREYIGYT